jgi:UDP-glucose 4-epimerase
MEKKGILVTGGAGYIGSHTVRQLGERGERLVTLDNLSTGFRDAVLYGDLVEGDTGDQELVDRILREYDVDTVIHFAAHTIVPESVSDPLKYYRNNTCNSRNLIDCCVRHGVKNFIFSSTAAVYGIPEDEIVSEETPKNPINPYGTSKLMTEWMLRDTAAASDMKYIALRYFNVAGSDPEGRIGQRTPNATLLIKVASEVATGKRPHLSVFGTDFPTPDGTGVRDYIHVEDLADAHLSALDYLRKGGDSNIFNCGYGHGYSVRDVIKALERATRQPLPIKEEPRRAGDPPSLVANSSKIQSHLDWKPQYDDLNKIVQDSLNWEKQLP